MVSTLDPDRKPNVPYVKKSDVHGDWLPIPKATIDVQPQHAVNFLIDTYMNTTEPITLVPVGPLTNLGMALRLEPHIAEHIPEVVIMGGGHALGNITPSAEWNIYVDPEAARIVMQSGIPIRLVPLDATHAAYTSYNPVVPVARPSLTAVSSTVTPGTDMVMCLSCHVPHGSPNDDLLRWDYNGMVAGGGGDDGTGCFVCHTEKD